MLNPNSYAVTQAKTNAVSKLILLSFFATSWNLCLELWKLFEPSLGTFTWNLGIRNPCLELWNFPKPVFVTPVRNLDWELSLGTSEPLGTSTQNFGTYRMLYLEPFLGTWEPLSTFAWNLYLKPQTSSIGKYSKQRRAWQLIATWEDPAQGVKTSICISMWTAPLTVP